MIKNSEDLSDLFKCGKIMGRELAKSLPILSLHGGFYYFSITKDFEEAYKKLPVWFKMLKNL